jgi:hypothetical protein
VGVEQPPDPVGAQRCKGSGRGFRATGVEVGLFGEPERDLVVGVVAVQAAVLDDEVVVAVLDLGPAGGERREQLQGYACDFADGVALADGVRPDGEVDAEVLGGEGFDGGVVVLGGGDGDAVQGAAVDAAPPAVDAADLVGDGDVGVQVRVAVAGS